MMKCCLLGTIVIPLMTSDLAYQSTVRSLNGEHWQHGDRFATAADQTQLSELHPLAISSNASPMLPVTRPDVQGNYDARSGTFATSLWTTSPIQ